MAGKQREETNCKTPYETKRDNNIRSKNSQLKKLNLGTTPNPSASLPKECFLADLEDLEDVADQNYVVDNEEVNDDDVGDETNEHGGVHYEPVEETHVQLNKERNVRGPTKMRSNIATQGKIKLYVKINRYGQPCGIKTCNFTNFIDVLVKGGDISLKNKDWRMVLAQDKKKIWTLINVKAQKNKEIRQNQVNALHTCGSRSYDVVSNQLKTYLVVNLPGLNCILLHTRRQMDNPLMKSVKIKSM